MIGISIARVFQIISGVIVLALSVTAIKWQRIGSAPASTGFNAFAGAWAILIGLIGFAAVFISAFPAIIMGVLDLLAFLILLAGGIAYAVQSSKSNCSAYNNADYDNPILNGLFNGGQDGQRLGFYDDPNFNPNSPDYSFLGGRCSLVKADDAFLFVGCVASLAAGILVFVGHRGKR